MYRTVREESVDTDESLIAGSLKTASGKVSVASATAPVSGQVLTATGATTATWQTPTGGGVTLGLVNAVSLGVYLR